MVYKGGAGEDERGPNPISAVVVPVVGETSGVDATDVVGAVGVRGAEPPVGGAAVIIGDALVISLAA